MTTPQRDPVYVIAPLKWEEVFKRTLYSAKTVFGTLVVVLHHPSYSPFGWCLELGTETLGKNFDTLEAAQAAADHWHRERLMPALVRVNTQGDERERD